MNNKNVTGTLQLSRNIHGSTLLKQFKSKLQSHCKQSTEHTDKSNVFEVSESSWLLKLFLLCFITVGLAYGL